MKNNKKGFTLIELLAVIVILAILVMLAIPAVTRYLNSARKNTFSDNALRAVEAVRNDVIEKGFSSTRSMCDGGVCTYNLSAINDLLETKLVTSSFGNDYTGDKACVVIVVNQSTNGYTMTMVDNGGNGFIDKVPGSSGNDAINADNITNDGTLKGADATVAKCS